LALSNLQQTVAPYGTWSSPITAELAARAGTRLTGAWLERGIAWWLEGRPAENGRVACLSGLVAVEQLTQCVDPQPLPQMGVERRDRLPEEDGVVLQAWVGVNGSTTDDLQVEQSHGNFAWVQGRRQAPRGARGGEAGSDVGDAHPRSLVASVTEPRASGATVR
jgi:hypothetical protein